MAIESDISSSQVEYERAENVVAPCMNKPPQIMECVGLAGAGKTSVSDALYRQSRRATAGQRLRMGRIRNIPFCLTHGFSLLPMIVNVARKSRWPTKDEFKWMLYLNGWHRVLKQQSADHNAVVVVDQGPLFYLATLLGFGPAELIGLNDRSDCSDPSSDPSDRSAPSNLYSLGHTSWWETVIREWASTLDVIVWLDAPDDVLMDRINGREKPHRVLGEEPAEIQQFLTTYRCCYEIVMTQVRAAGDVVVLSYDTSCQSLEAITAEVVMQLGEN